MGFLEARLPSERVLAAARLAEQVLQANARACMAVDLHVEAVRNDYERLQEEHNALVASEARYRELSANLEQRVQEQVKTLEQSQRQLYQTEKLASVGQLAAGVAHEINNPMGFIRSNLNTARGYLRSLAGIGSAVQADAGQAAVHWSAERFDDLLGDFADLLGESLDGADRVARIVADLKAFSSLEHDEEAPLDLNESLRVVCSVASGQAGSGVNVRFEHAPLPLYTCAAGRINQVLLNLLLNGIAAVGEAGEVKVETRLVGDDIHVVFQDSGCGIAPEHLDRIFDPFFTTKAVGAGTGLGLTVSRDIVRGYGGMLDVQSQVGSGTRVTVRLPL